MPWDGGLGFVVLRFPRADAHHVPTVEPAPIPGPRSLLEATAREFFAIVVHALGSPEPGRELSLLIREPEDIVRAAGKEFLARLIPGEMASSSRRTRLFTSLEVISSLRYEGGVGRGKMLISRIDHPAVEVRLRFSSPIPLRNFRAIRKLLELATKDLFLLADGSYAYGLGAQIAPVDPAAADLLGVDFLDRSTWKLRLDQKELMLVTHGQPALPRQRVREEKFRQAVLELFPGTPPRSVDRLWALARTAIEESPGTLLVVSAGASEEAERLESQGTKILPSGLTPEMLRLVSSIDGAVLLDPNAVCHAIGVVLDGRAGKNGDPSRGARYNSAVRYQASSPYPCLALVVSEDGAVDLLGVKA